LQEEKALSDCPWKGEKGERDSRIGKPGGVVLQGGCREGPVCKSRSGEELTFSSLKRNLELGRLRERPPPVLPPRKKNFFP